MENIIGRQLSAKRRKLSDPSKYSQNMTTSSPVEQLSNGSSTETADSSQPLFNTQTLPTLSQTTIESPMGYQMSGQSSRFSSATIISQVIIDSPINQLFESTDNYEKRCQECNQHNEGLALIRCDAGCRKYFHIACAEGIHTFPVDCNQSNDPKEEDVSDQLKKSTKMQWICHNCRTLPSDQRKPLFHII